MEHINLVYWDDVDNWGDFLSPYIIGKLSGLPVRHKKLYLLGRKGQLQLLGNFILGKVVKEDLLKTLFFFERNLLGIGSILSKGNKRSIVWGSGFINSNECFSGGKVYAVRGKLSNEKIIEAGFDGCSVFGDPAILLPMFVKPSPVRDKYPLGIVPHWKETDFFMQKYGNDFKVIDLRTKDIERVIDEITSCRAILSSSLHGIIASHAYGIPAIWIKHGYIDTDGFKFADYFSSVNINNYDGFENYDDIIRDENLQKKLFMSELSLPNVDMVQMRQQLIDVFPYKSKYKSRS
ncbi:MAG: polysaccharide pyruvyl transferase family protein [Bacteroidetes bacterium]|uniref:Polysaccharide pyruvyl transferase family protein n=1 Tax=Candidatus Limisoma faecipullorum TaxID=2840854 RepID=A0A9D9NKB6_9BACT|nr:polysaccharide pyruvyl transferase family protein [Candidatus Limisoma faecipullorum]